MTDLDVQPGLDREEAKRHRFLRNAPRRTRSALHALALVENCFNAQAYRYTEAEAEKTLAALQEAMDGIRRKIHDKPRERLHETFSLDGE